MILQYHLVYFPELKIIDAGNEFATVSAALGTEELVISDPRINGPLLAVQTEPNVGINVHFDKAVFFQKLVDHFKRIGLILPEQATPISYFVKGNVTGSKSFIRMDLQSSREKNIELHFFNSDPQGSPLGFEVKPINAELMVTMGAPSPFDNVEEQSRLLRFQKAGAWERIPITGLPPIKVIVPEGSSFRLHFDTSFFSSDGKPFNIRVGDEFSPFQAEEVLVKLSGQTAPVGSILRIYTEQTTLLSLIGLTPGKTSLLNISDFRITANEIQIDISGRGWVEKNGEVETRDVWAFLKSNPLIGLLLGALNAALLSWFLNWLKGIVWGKTKEG